MMTQCGVLIDREASKDGVNRYFMTTGPTIAECFNTHPVEYGGGTATVPARNLGALVYGWTNGKLSLESHWFYESLQKTPQRVLLHNALQGEWPYPSPDQAADRVVELVVEGWEDVPLHLELVDPPDLAPYIPKDLDDPTDFAEFPYEADDNVGEVAGEYGFTVRVRAGIGSQNSRSGVLQIWLARLSETAGVARATLRISRLRAGRRCGSDGMRKWEHIPARAQSSDGSGAAATLTVTPGADDLATFYLKVPPNVSGNNYQVKVGKVDQGTGVPISDRVVGFSPFYTTWKRIYVERDKMFREGGLLARDFNPATCGTGGVEPGCNELIMFDWANVENGDIIVLFQSDRPAEAAGTVTGTITTPPASGPYANSVRVALDIDLSNAGIGLVWSASSDNPPNPGDTATIDFQAGASAGIGVISGCDSASNQINDPGSCFFDTDTRAVEQTSADPFVEIIAPRSDISVVPYYPGEEKDTLPRWQFSWLWFGRQNEPNFVHAIGAVGAVGSDGLIGLSRREQAGIFFRTSYVFIKRIEDVIANHEAYCFQYRQVDEVAQDTTIHELLHQFRLNTLIPDTGEHCYSSPWTGGDGCLMHKLSNFHCPGIDPMRLDADGNSLTSANGGDLYDVRYENDPLP